jgi:hypothetical protein
MNEPDAALFNRLRDLQGSLGEDLDWLISHPRRADGLHDLGERLADLGTGLLQRAADVNAETLTKLPAAGWLPEAGTRPGDVRAAHFVGERPVRCGPVYLAVCGAACFPFYGRDATGRTDRHPRCEACERWGEISPGYPRG